VPNLIDFDWLWEVTGFEMTQTEAVFEIMQTILYGVRSQDCPESIKRYGVCPDMRFSQMPAYSDLGLTDEQLNGLVDYVYSLTGANHDAGAVENISGLTGICVECHGDEGGGYKAFGGPDLSDDIWLFGDSREQVLDFITKAVLLGVQH
jgi:cytochrome c oxidase cbb3-type subunit 3